MATDSSEDLFNFEVHQYEFLKELGFVKTVKADGVVFRSKNLIFTLSKQRWGEPAQSKLEEVNSGEELPSPLTALQFFLDNYDNDWADAISRYAHFPTLRASIAAIAALCRTNGWIFTSTEWACSPQFKKAIDETQRWFLSTRPPPSAAQVVEKLRSLRP